MNKYLFMNKYLNHQYCYLDLSFPKNPFINIDEKLELPLAHPTVTLSHLLRESYQHSAAASLRIQGKSFTQ